MVTVIYPPLFRFASKKRGCPHLITPRCAKDGDPHFLPERKKWGLKLLPNARPGGLRLDNFALRISGINLPDKKTIEYALPYIYGVGLSASRLILKSANVTHNKKAGDLTPEEVSRIQNILEKSYKVEGDLRREVGENIKRLKEIGTWRGTRHARRLPIHGRTRVNSRTLRGNVRRTMGSGRKETGQKT